MAGKRQVFVHEIVLGTQVFHDHTAATEVCSHQKEQSRPFLTLVLKEMDARRLGLHIISSIIK